MVLTESDKHDYEAVDMCRICNIPWTQTRGDFKVRDHDHITGRYRGVVHCSCNLKLKVDPQKIQVPVIVHNCLGSAGT